MTDRLLRPVLRLIRQILARLSPRVELRRWTAGAGLRRHRWESRAAFVHRVTREPLRRARLVGSDFEVVR